MTLTEEKTEQWKENDNWTITEFLVKENSGNALEPPRQHHIPPPSPSNALEPLLCWKLIGKSYKKSYKTLLCWKLIGIRLS